MIKAERYARSLPFLFMALFYIGRAVEQFSQGGISKNVLGSLMYALFLMLAIWRDLKTNDQRLPAWVYLLGSLATAVTAYIYPVHERWEFVCMASVVATALVASAVIHFNASRHK